jgi:hypothetical protein
MITMKRRWVRLTRSGPKRTTNGRSNAPNAADSVTEITEQQPEKGLSMRTLIRKNRTLTYRQQMDVRNEDAARSRQHFNSFMNDVRQRLRSMEDRQVLATVKEVMRADRAERRRIKKQKLLALGYTRAQIRGMSN